MSTINKYITTNFQFLSDNLNPAEGLAQLQDDCYGVIQNVQKRPIALVIAEDLQKAASEGVPSLLQTKAILPTTIVVGCAVEMQDFADSKAKRVLLREADARGAVVLNDEGVIGVLPVQAFRNYLKREYELLGGELGSGSSVGDTILFGPLMPPIYLEICRQCWHINKFNQDEWQQLERLRHNPDPNLQQQLPMCQNRDVPSHPLKL